MAARELCSGVHLNLREVLYYTAVANDAKSAVPHDRQNTNQQFDARPPELSRWRRMQIPVIAWAVYWVVRLIGPTLRVEYVGVQNAVQIRDAGEAAIGAFWHRCIFSAIWVWRKRGIVVLNTVNFDGQWTRRVIERLGFGTAQGSSTRGAIEGLTIMASPLEGGKHLAPTIARPAIRSEARSRDSRAANGETSLGFSPHGSKSAHVQEILGFVPASISVL